MKFTQILFLTVFSCLALSLLALAEEPEMKSIFNGKDLTGWKAPDDNIWFSVEDEMLRVKSGPKKKGQK